MNYFKKFWNFLKEDTWSSWFISLLLLVILIRFIFFPTLTLITASPLPLVVIESCSLYHESSFNSWWDSNSAWYESREISKSDFQSFPFKSGLNKGDIIFVWGRSDYKIGDIIIFNPNSDSTAKHPIIHRVISENPLETKGDHNKGQLTSGDPSNPQNIDETNIPRQNVIGKASFKVPLLGWIKLIFFEPFRAPHERGLCK